MFRYPDTVLKKRKKQLLIALVVLVLLLVGGAFFVISANKPKVEEKQSVEATVQTLKPEEIGLKLSVTADKKKVKFAIDKASDIQAIEYQLTYEADSTAQERSDGGEDRVQRGITGQATIKSGESSFNSEDLDLGSCSKNVCHYDTGVKSVDITLKITKNGGKVYDVTDTLAF